MFHNLMVMLGGLLAGGVLAGGVVYLLLDGPWSPAPVGYSRLGNLMVEFVAACLGSIAGMFVGIALWWKSR